VTHTIRALRAARRAALRALVDSSHWLTVPDAAALVPVSIGVLRRWLATPANQARLCDRGPTYRTLRGRRARVLSPADVRAIRGAVLARAYR
jgi:hypothetical protein